MDETLINELFKLAAAVTGIVGVPSIGAIILWIVRWIKNTDKEKKRNEELQNEALQVVICDKLEDMYMQIIEHDCITDDDLKRWSKRYRIYHELGENGIMDAKNEKVMNLKIVEHY